MWNYLDILVISFVIVNLFIFLVEGFISLTHAHMPNVRGLLETVRSVWSNWWSSICLNLVFTRIPSIAYKVIDVYSWMWIQGLQEKIKLVPIDLKNRPDWYKEKVYPANKVSKSEMVVVSLSLKFPGRGQRIKLVRSCCFRTVNWETCFIDS